MSITFFRSAVSRRTASVLAAVALLSGSVVAKTPFPTKPVRLVVTLPAGSSPDVVARFVAERLAKDLGQQVIVENKPGASSIIGTDAVAKAPADGYTLLFAISSSVSINPHLFSRLPYKASDFVPVVHLVNVPVVLVVRADSPYKSLGDLVQAAKREPVKLNYASYGEGTQTHLAAVQLLQRTGAVMTHVPIKDGGVSYQGRQAASARSVRKRTFAGAAWNSHLFRDFAWHGVVGVMERRSGAAWYPCGNRGSFVGGTAEDRSIE
jgi:tripartite-type tricarboxylate transporter receptor subunit TctC